MSSKSAAKSGPKGIPAPKQRAVPEKAAEVVKADASEEEGTAAEEGGKAGALKLRELITRVVDATGAKKKDAKTVVEATLEQLGAALVKGEELNLPGVGRVRIARSMDKNGLSLMTLKVRGAGAAKKKEPKEALAEAEEAV
ncbi:HU family DNA-binding protein [Thioclava sp. FR2]|uniref:HU family DNA-binding protein n=1 Tax=Thioclava sp. FR2 TaxID=3445780 RepID=UPI003EBB1C54